MSSYFTSAASTTLLQRSYRDGSVQYPRTSDHESPDHACRAVLLGESLTVRRLRSQVERIAPYLRTALIRGEPGCGKRLVAQMLHTMSPRTAGPFVACNASALAGAVAMHPSSADANSLLDSAAGGTLYLEDAGELPYPLQTALLRFLASREAARTSLENTRAERIRQTLDVRILASTHRDLRTLAAAGHFRRDLYSRLAAVEIVAPALRERADDLPVLADWILQRLSRRTALPARNLSPSALIEVLKRPWTGNLRELEQVLTHAAALAEGNLIEARHMPPATADGAAPPAQTFTLSYTATDDRLEDVINGHVLAVLTRCGGNKLRAAERLGISRSTLYRMLESCSAQPAKA